MLRFSAFCFHSLLLITHTVLVLLCVVAQMLQCVWMLRWLSKEWQAAKSQNCISLVIESAFSTDIKLERPLNFLWMAKLSFCHKKPTWWLWWQIHGCSQPSPFANHSNQVFLGYGSLLGNFIVFASTFLGDSHRDTSQVLLGDGDLRNQFCPLHPHFLHFSHCPLLGWTRSTLTPLSIQAQKSLFKSELLFLFFSLLLHSHPSQTPHHHAVCLLLGKAHLLLLTLSLLIIHHILWEGAGWNLSPAHS